MERHCSTCTCYDEEEEYERCRQEYLRRVERCKKEKEEYEIRKRDGMKGTSDLGANEKLSSIKLLVSYEDNRCIVSTNKQLNELGVLVLIDEDEEQIILNDIKLPYEMKCEKKFIRVYFMFNGIILW